MRDFTSDRIKSIKPSGIRKFFDIAEGKATVRIEVGGDPLTVSITFIDGGKPYDPLAKTDPDVTLAAEERNIGGLGIFITKKYMDDVVYEYRNGKNVLTLKKTV